MKLSDSIVEVLKVLDVGYLFGVSGANIEHLHDAVNRLGGSRLKSVLSKTETGGAFMADCHARVHRKLGVCCATSGGGMMNLIVGIAESYNDSVPVLAIVGQPPSSMAGRGAFQDSSGRGRSVDAKALWHSVTKYSATVDDRESWWDQLARAIGYALGGRPGPSALLIPRDKFDVEVGEMPAGWVGRLHDFGVASPDPEQIRRLFEALHDARRPVFILGQGVRRCSSPEAVVRFARSTGIPVALTPSARAEYPNNAPNFLGICGITGLPSVHEYLEQTADLLILVGTSVDVMSRGPIVKCAQEGRHTFIVNIDPHSVYAEGPHVEVAKGDAGEIFLELEKLQRIRPYRHPEMKYRRRWVKARRAEYPDQESDEGLLLSSAIGIIARNMPPAGHIILDAGNCAATSLHLMDVPNAMSSTIALGMGGMGYSIAAAVGAQLGSAEGTTTIVMVGDAAFLMTGFELHTAVELNLPILCIVFNNNMHGMCAVRQQLYFESRYECVNFQNRVDFPALARALGESGRLWTGRAESSAELETALRDYYRNPALPGLLEICLGAEEIPPFLPFLSADTEFTDQRAE